MNASSSASLNATAASGWLRPHAAELPREPDPPAAGCLIGVLALQGAFAEHVLAVQRLGGKSREVRRPDQLEGLDALLMPGGESTTMSKLLESSGLWAPLGDRLRDGLPVFGTCAGMILLARDVLDRRPDQRSFGVLDVAVRRNAYGRQIDSFETDLSVAGLDAPFHAVFIRAPQIESLGPGVEPLATHEGHAVLVRSGTTWAAAFHPELTDDLRIHRLFLTDVLSRAVP